MSATHPRPLGLADRELVSIVGAGGKSTILFALGRDLAAAGARVILTTTTRVGENQPGEPICWCSEPAVVEAALAPGVPVFVAAGRAPGKIVGPSPAAVDLLFEGTGADYVVVEADGAAGMAIKAPAGHEPVIPSGSTTVVVVASIAAVGQPISAVAHRPDRVASLIGAQPGDRLTLDGIAAVLLHPAGGIKGVPESARVVMAITGVTPPTEGLATALAGILASDPRVERAITWRHEC
jgi:probable selenium-dependent hydroxylase accessory protein YqeC